MPNKIRFVLVDSGERRFPKPEEHYFGTDNPNTVYFNDTEGIDDSDGKPGDFGILEFNVLNVTDVCIAGAAARDGFCGDPECVCARGNGTIASTAKEIVLAIDSAFPTVMGLTCICPTPELHSEDCVALRQALIRYDNAVYAGRE